MSWRNTNRSRESYVARTVFGLREIEWSWDTIYPIPTTVSGSITKTCLYNFDSLKPHFYTVKLGFTGVNIIFLISAQNIDCGYSLEPPRQGGSNEYPQSMFWAEIWFFFRIFHLKTFLFWVVKFLVYLNRLVLVMTIILDSASAWGSVCVFVLFPKELYQ